MKIEALGENLSLVLEELPCYDITLSVVQCDSMYSRQLLTLSSNREFIHLADPRQGRNASSALSCPVRRVEVAQSRG